MVVDVYVSDVCVVVTGVCTSVTTSRVTLVTTSTISVVMTSSVLTSVKVSVWFHVSVVSWNPLISSTWVSDNTLLTVTAVMVPLLGPVSPT